MENTMTGATEKMNFLKHYMENFSGKIKEIPLMAWAKIREVGREDPRRFIHALKVGLSLTLVSLLYLMEPLFKGIGENTIWAVMTVVVVLEFTAGATLCKGLNRGFGTFLAGSLAFVVQYIAHESGRVFRAIFIGVAVFLIGTACTYIRFIPHIKKNYDYGVLIFLLTFNLISVSSYRVQNVVKMAHERFYTIAIGCSLCLLMSLVVLPNWSGEELHNSIVYKMEGLSRAIQACVNGYFSDEDAEVTGNEISSDDHIYKGYGSVLNSKHTEETLALHASWEPRHLRQCKFPWEQYIKLGAALRHFGYTVVALDGCLQTEIQTPRTIRAIFKDPCARLAIEASKALTQLAESIRSRRHCSPEALSDNLQEALQDLNTALKSQPRLFLSPNTLSTSKRELKVLRPSLSKIASTSLEFSEALPFAAFASLLVEAVARLDLVIEEVEELGRVANFKEFEEVTCEMNVNSQKKNMENPGDLENHLPSYGVE